MFIFTTNDAMRNALPPRKFSLDRVCTSRIA